MKYVLAFLASQIRSANNKRARGVLLDTCFAPNLLSHITQNNNHNTATSRRKATATCV